MLILNKDVWSSSIRSSPQHREWNFLPEQGLRPTRRPLECGGGVIALIHSGEEQSQNWVRGHCVHQMQQESTLRGVYLTLVKHFTQSCDKMRMICGE